MQIDQDYQKYIQIALEKWNLEYNFVQIWNQDKEFRRSMKLSPNHPFTQLFMSKFKKYVIMRAVQNTIHQKYNKYILNDIISAASTK